jgi:Zn-dependent protease with chaperone function
MISTPGGFWLLMMWFFIAYGVVIALMFLGGLMLAKLTRGPRALDLLGAAPDTLVGQGQVVRTAHESWLTRLYVLALLLALVLFYVAIPFVLWGLAGIFVILLVLSFWLRRGELAGLHSDLLKASAGGSWAVFKALFAGFGQDSFGLVKTRQDCPRLHESLAEVAGRVDTEPVDQVYIAPGSTIGVYQQGRGPFGLFGARRRVLILGLSTMHFLTVAELKSILAHEYAHFSHQDTFWSRFIYQVSLSVRTAMDGMAAAGGWVTYVNPFYWFFYLYHKAYALLSGGFSRSREFLADRMACSLYGADVFATALEKVCTDGTLFQMTVYKNIADLLKRKKAFVNMYLAFRRYRNERLDGKERGRLYRDLLNRKASLFDSHPTFKERIDAVQALPKAAKADATPALELFEDAEGIERELTDFLTASMSRSRRRGR